MWRSFGAGGCAVNARNARVAHPRQRPDGSTLRYRVFFVLPDQMEGRCELGQDTPISIADVDTIERALMERLGCGNALVIGWQELGTRSRAPCAAGRGDRA